MRNAELRSHKVHTHGKTRMTVTERSSKKRKDCRDGWYGFDLWEHQKAFVDSIPIDGKNYLIVAPVGVGKTRMSAYYISRIMKDRDTLGIHTCAIVVAANQAQARDQMREYGDFNQKPYNQSKQSWEKANKTAANMRGSHHTTITMTPHMFAMCCGSSSGEGEVMNKMRRLLDEFDTDTKCIVILYDEVHDLYWSTKKKANKQALKNIDEWKSCFTERGIQLIFIGVTATPQMNSDTAQCNATNLFGVTKEDLASITIVMPEDMSRVHDKKMKIDPIPPIAKSRTNRIFRGEPKDCKLSPELLQNLSDITIGQQLMRFMGSSFLSHRVVPYCMVDTALKNAIVDTATDMMIDKGHLLKSIASEPVAGVIKTGTEIVTKTIVKPEGTEVVEVRENVWAKCSVHPSAVVFFQTERQRVTFFDALREEAEDEDSSRDIVCIHMNDPYTADSAIESFNKERLVRGDEDRPKNVILAPHKMYRKSANILARCTPSVVILVGNYGTFEVDQMLGRTPRFSEHFAEGDILPADPVKGILITSMWVDRIASSLKSIQTAKEVRSPRYSMVGQNGQSLDEMISEIATSDAESDHSLLFKVAKNLDRCALVDSFSGPTLLGNKLISIYQSSELLDDFKVTFEEAVKKMVQTRDEEDEDAVFDTDQSTEFGNSGSAPSVIEDCETNTFLLGCTHSTADGVP